jgi:hypothetical protein
MKGKQAEILKLKEMTARKWVSEHRRDISQMSQFGYWSPGIRALGKRKPHYNRLQRQVITEALYNTDGYPKFVPLKHTLRSLPTFQKLTFNIILSLRFYINHFFHHNNCMKIHEMKLNAEGFTRLYSVNRF